jgi:glutaredoxin
MTDQTRIEAPSATQDTRTATLYRMVMPEHVCPWGLKAKHLLRRQGYEVEDHWLTTKAENEAFKAEHGVKTTPQTFIGGQRIGGYEDLRRHFGLKVKDPEATSYVPVIAVFAAAAALALAASQAMLGSPFTVMAAEWFVAFAMVILAMLKLQDVERFSTMFLGYDLLARRWVTYSYVYPLAEFIAGTLMAAHALDWLSIPLALFIGTVGGTSVFYAVYVQKRELKCACVGGSSRVPLGFVSLSENLAMVGMALWMLATPHG